MAELATIARPYAEALLAAGADAATVAQLHAVARVAAEPELQSFAAHPKAAPEQVFDLICTATGQALSAPVQNLLRAVIDNGRLAAVPEMAVQAQALLDARSGISQAHVSSAFPMSDEQVQELRAVLEKRFGRKLELSVAVDTSLIGGIRAEVGDEVLDTSVKARLDRMKTALTA
jgi:F-type H+-transporting ATPase subunit delta